jgi:nucleoside recognition membrane protein YjiH
MSRGYLVVLVLAVLIGIARFVLPVEGRISHDDIFKDIAHLFVGGVFGAAILATHHACDIITPLWLAMLKTWRLWTIAWGLTVLEVIAFIARRT